MHNTTDFNRLNTQTLSIHHLSLNLYYNHFLERQNC